jgi:AraC-like DNA-binding protein
MELVFTLDTDGQARSGVAGARSEFLVLDTSRPFSVIGVHFRPGGGFPLFGVPAGELHNRSVTLELDMVWGGYAATVTDRLWEAETSERRFRILERALLERARDWLDRHPAVRYALDLFDRSNGTCPVSDVVQRIGMSQRWFGQLFRSQVGLSPKVFCRIRRFNEALRRIEQVTDVDWLDVALSCGYFDQAHFNHDIIVVGASAGGVEALREIAAGLPADLPAAVFCAVHVAPAGPHLRPAILTAAGRMPAKYAEDGEEIINGRIYLAPPDNHMLVRRGVIGLNRGPRENWHRPAVDPLFRSAAVAYGPRVIGMILTGNLDDGASRRTR